MLDALEFAAVVVSAIYGILRAIRNRLDVVGAISLAFAVAFGGGTLRDLLLARQPLFWVAREHYPVIVFFLAVAATLMPRRVLHAERYLAIPDALGLGLFSIVGAGYALEAGTSLFVASIIGVITGTFGGVIGDVICNEIPSLFRASPLHATCSFVGSWVYLMLDLTTLDNNWSMALGITATVVLRLAALQWNLQLPQPKHDEASDHGP